MRRLWTGEKLSVRLSEVAFVLVLAGALVWAGWFASASQNATWTPVLVSIAVVGAVAPGARRSWPDRPVLAVAGPGRPGRGGGVVRVGRHRAKDRACPPSSRPWR
jgi:hypothetical protein